MRIQIYISVWTLMVIVTVTGNAQVLPEGAVTLEAEAVRMLHAGKIEALPDGHIYYDPDGTLLVLSKGQDSFGEGHWIVNGNRVCIYISKYIDSSLQTTVSCSNWYGDPFGKTRRWTGQKWQRFDTESRYARSIDLQQLSAAVQELKDRDQKLKYWGLSELEGNHSNDRSK